MKNLKFLLLFVLFGGLFFACTKDLEGDLVGNGNIHVRNDSTQVDTSWQSSTDAQFVQVWQDFMRKISDEELRYFYNQNGFFDWSEAQTFQETDQGNFLFSVPTIKNSNVQSVLFAWKHNDAIKYHYATIADISRPTQEIIDEYGVELTILTIMTFFNHEKHLYGYARGVMWQHLEHPVIKTAFDGVTPRGWCLIRFRLNNTDVIESPMQQTCQCTWKNERTGEEIHGTPPPPTGLTDWDDSYQEGDTYSVTGIGTWRGGIDPRSAADRGIIHGSRDRDGIETYYFWAWCPDDENQVTDSNFSTNMPPGYTSPSGGNSGGAVIPSTPTREEIEDANWIAYNELDHRVKNMMQLEFDRLIGDIDLTFEEFIRMGGMDAFNFILSGAGGDDSLIDEVELDENDLETFLCKAAAQSFINNNSLSITADELGLIIGNPPNCFDWELFNGYAQGKLDELFLNSEVLEAPKNEIENLSQALKDCFGENGVDCTNFNGTLSITLFADQPVSNTTNTWDMDYDSEKGKYLPDVGHAFISLSMNENNSTTTLVPGFYPSGPVAPGVNPHSTGAFGDDSGREYHSSITFELSCEKFNKLLQAINDYSNTIGGVYNLHTNNCTDFVIFALNRIGLDIPDNEGDWPGGSGSNPANLGEDIRNYENTEENYSIDNDGGNAPFSNCL